MKRSSVLDLKKEVWISPIKGDPLEVALVPAAAGYLTWINTDPDTFCTEAFVNFKGFTENDGTAVENTLSERVTILTETGNTIKREIILALTKAGEIQAEGEGSADSD